MSFRIAPTGQQGRSTASLLTEMQGVGTTAAKTPPTGELAVREKFQDFVGGTFYKEMLKSLRAAQRPSKYLNGGQAEKIFQGQMDQQIAEDLAHQYARHLADPLFENFSRQSQSRPSRSLSMEAGRALDAVA
jgi:Rod binding domain-containing protein